MQELLSLKMRLRINRGRFSINKLMNWLKTIKGCMHRLIGSKISNILYPQMKYSNKNSIISYNWATKYSIWGNSWKVWWEFCKRRMHTPKIWNTSKKKMLRGLSTWRRWSSKTRRIKLSWRKKFIQFDNKIGWYLKNYSIIQMHRAMNIE